MALSAVKKESAKPAAEPAADTPPPKKRALNWKLAVIALCVLGAAGGGAYWYMNRGHADTAKEVRAEPAKPPQFLPLETFTVNLQLEDNPQFLQVGLTLKVSGNEAVEALKLYMPEVRDRVLLLLSSQKASVLLTIEGKRKLAADIVSSINAIVAPSATHAQPSPKTTAPAPAEGDAKAPEAEAKPETEADAKPEAESGAKPEAEAATKPAAERGDAHAAAPALPVLGVLFTSFIVQ